MGGMLGTAGGAAGTGFATPQTANIEKPYDAKAIQGAQGDVNNALTGQGALLSALQNQNGLGNQNMIQQNMNNLQQQYNQANGLGIQQGAISGLQGAAQGIQGIAGQQANTANMYQNIANGTGPNPAQAMLNQQTGANVANQAALMAGQRGAGANVGLMARQAAQQGAATQQQAVGQGATMQANQQLNALSGLTAAQQAQVGTQQALAGTQQAIGGMGTGISSQQMAAQNAAAQQANQVAGQQIGGTGAMTQAQLTNLGQQQNALASQNNAAVSNQNNINSGNAGLAQTGMQGQQGVVGGLMNSAGAASKLATGAQGGEVHKYAIGGMAGPQSSYGQFINNTNVAQGPEEYLTPQAGANPAAESMKKGINFGPKKPAQGDPTTPDTLAGPDAAPTGAPGSMDGGGGTMMSAKGGLASKGGHVKAQGSAQKAVKSGNSYDNDKVPALLSEGEIVIPRDVAMGKDPVNGAAKFVATVLAKRKSK